MHILAPVHLAVECTFDLVVLAAVPLQLRADLVESSNLFIPVAARGNAGLPCLNSKVIMPAVSFSLLFSQTSVVPSLIWLLQYHVARD